MSYKIEMRYSYGWDDAGWTDSTGDTTSPSRFPTIAAGLSALNEFFANVHTAVATGDMNMAESSKDYRIVKTDD